MQAFIKKMTILALCLSFCLYALPSFGTEEPATDTGEKEDAAPTENSLDNLDTSLQEVQNELQNALRDIVSASGAIFSGMAAGMQEGAQKAQEQLDSVDGAKLATNKESLAELLQVSVYRVEKQDNGMWRIVLAVRNENEFPVRLVNLTQKHAVLLLDSEGFAHEPTEQGERPRTVTVAARAAVKALFDFVDLEGEPRIFRLFDTDFSVQQNT